MDTPPWSPGETPEEREERKAAYERLASAARRAGMPLERLRSALENITRNEAETRRFLAEEVYHVPDELLDDLVRVKLAELDKES